jgi:phosphoribosylpyrophosphate synthetase
MYIKKEGETSHSGRVPYPPLGFVTNVIIDDFISTGETVNTIARMIIEQGIIINGVCISGPITLRDLSFQCEFVIAQEIKPNT